ncbi:MAG: hypothetical protein ACLFV7_01270 [Phycisphaerae bacterium]
MTARTHENADTTFSLIAPTSFGADELGRYVDRLEDLQDALGEPSEILLIVRHENASARGAAADVCLRRPGIRMLALANWDSPQGPLRAGLDHARGRAAIVLATNGSFREGDVTEMVARWREGFEVVHPSGPGSPTDRNAGSLTATAREFLSGITAQRRTTGVPDAPMLLDRTAMEVIRANPFAAVSPEALGRAGLRTSAVSAEVNPVGAVRAGRQEHFTSLARREPWRWVALGGVALLAAGALWGMLRVVTLQWLTPGGLLFTLLPAALGALAIVTAVQMRRADELQRRLDSSPAYVVRESAGFEHAAVATVTRPAEAEQVPRGISIFT